MAVTAGLLHGVQGNAVITSGDIFAAFVVQVNQWSFHWENERFGADVFGGTNKGHKYYRAMYDVTGTIAGYINGIAFTTAAFDPGIVTATLTLTERTNATYSGEAHLVLDLSVDRKTGLNAYTATFQSDGDWVETFA
jgi:hypothetical protein